MTPAYEVGVPLDEYRAWPAYSSSDLKAFRDGPPAMVPWRKLHPSAETDATRLGTAAHCAILEPDLFAERFAHKPEGMTFASKEGKAWRDEHAGQTILTHEEWCTVGAIQEAFCENTRAFESIEAASAREASLRWTDPDTGLPLKARPDWFEHGGYVTDLKITRHAGNDLQYRAWVNGWMHQVALYRTGLIAIGIEIKGCRLVAINPVEPQSLRVYTVELKQDTVGMLALENERTIKEMAACHSSGNWPGVPDEWSLIELPPAGMRDQVLWPDEDGNEMAPLTGGGW